MNTTILQKIRLLVVGVGSIGERHVRCFLKTGRVCLSICETNHSLREDVGCRYDVERKFLDLDQALVEQFDAAVIAVPADLHISAAQRAVDAGLHVLIEKPLSVNLEGVDHLVSSIKRTNRVVALGYVLRNHPSLAKMKDAIDSREYGQPVQVCVVAGQHFPTYRPAYCQTYYSSRKRGGGAIQDAMTHLVNAAEWLVGPIDRVIADADHKVLPGVVVEDIVHFLARHGNVLGSYSLNQFQAPDEVTITVVCERGTIRFEGHHNRWRHMSHPGESWHDEIASEVERDTLFHRQAESFVNSIENGANPLCSIGEGLQSLRVNLALLESLESKSWRSIA